MRKWPLVLLQTAFVFATAAGSDLPEYRSTTSGALFVRAEEHPVWGEGWVDPDGNIVWYDAARDEGGSVALFKYAEADTLCARFGSRLPTREEFERLVDYMAERVVWGDYPYTRYRAQVLPNFGGHRFWSATAYDQNFQAQLDARNSDMLRISLAERFNGLAVRCVVDL